MKDIKIIFFDIDGTLIAMDQDTISEKTLEALKRLQEKGVKLCLATGRGPMLVPHFEGVEFDAFLTYNGSYCYDHSGTLYSNCIPLKDIERIIKNADKMGKPVALATKDRMAANGKDQGFRHALAWWPPESNPSDWTAIGAWPPAFPGIVGSRMWWPSNADKFVCRRRW